jgi:amidase
LNHLHIVAQEIKNKWPDSHFGNISVASITCKSPVNIKESVPDLKPYLEEMTITDLQKQYMEGKLSISQVVADYLTRIEAIDRNGPRLNSIICLNPDALKIAQELDKEMKEEKIRGPLHGIPVVLKDNIDTHDKMPTTAGAAVLRHSFPMYDSWVAKKLRDAGAVIIAKSNLSEWANCRATSSSCGWSGIGGRKKNLYIPGRNP